MNIYQTKLKHYQATVLAKYNRKPVIFNYPNSPISKKYIELTDEIFFSNQLVEV